MAEEHNTSIYGTISLTKPSSAGDLDSRVRTGFSSFYEDETVGAKNQITIPEVGVQQTRLQEEGQEEKLRTKISLSSNGVKSEHNNDATTNEEIPRPTCLSYSNAQPTVSTQGAASPVSARHVSFVREETKENEVNDATAALDNRGFSDMQSSSDSLTRVRAITNFNVHYQTHSEGEECNESDISVAGNWQQNFQAAPRRRRRRYSTRHGAIVSDSFVNECICCCVIF